MTRRKLDLTSASYVFHQDSLLFIYHAKLNMWLPPGGHIDPNESPDQAALREVMEETGLEATLLEVFPISVPEIPGNKGSPLPFFTNIHSVGDHDHWGACYVCESKTKEVRLSEESKEYCWLTREQTLSHSNIREDIKAIANMAFDHYDRFKSS